MTKHQHYKQTMEYSGFLFDTICGLMLCLDEKLALLWKHFAELGVQSAHWSLSDLDQVKSSLMHYSSAVQLLSCTSASASLRCRASWAHR